MPVHEEPFEPGTPCWADVMLDDLDRGRDFYGALFGWTFEDLPPDAGGYVMARRGGHVVAGAMAKNADDPGQVSVWTVYLATDDVDATADLAAGSGGVFFLGPMDVLEVGGSPWAPTRPGRRTGSGSRRTTPAPTSSPRRARCAGPSP
jgi:predicted enzyme related to lactoylglutathione lyase